MHRDDSSSCLDKDVATCPWAIRISSAWELGYRRTDDESLRSRVELSLLLHDLVPRLPAAITEDLIADWYIRFPNGHPITLEALNASRNALLIERRAKKEEENLDLSLADEVVRLWRQDTLDNPLLQYLPSVVPGDIPMPIDDVFVELFALADGDKVDVVPDQQVELELRRNRHVANLPTLSLPSMLSRTLEQCILLGEPGIGKSTIVRWLSRRIAKGEIQEFDAGFEVRLGPYANALRRENQLTLLEFALRQHNFSGRDLGAEIHALRAYGCKHRRLALLVDGWDEVPADMRHDVQKAIIAEQKPFVIVITSRPSGFPRQLAVGAQTEIYQVAGLSSASAEALIRNLLKSMGNSLILRTYVRP